MMDSLKLTSRKGQMGSGIYEAGDTDKCYVRLFVTDTGRVMPVNRCVITEDDLMEVYEWGLLDARPTQDFNEDESIKENDEKL